jgi:putative flippase GtrA
MNAMINMPITLPAYVKAKLLRFYQQRPTFWHFLLVGAAGFVFDMAIFFTLMQGFELSPIPARVLAFICAVLFTSFANRLFTFRARQHRAVTSQLLLSAAIGLMAGGVNLSTFYLLISSLPGTHGAHFTAFSCGILMGMIINWLGSNKISHKHMS